MLKKKKKWKRSCHQNHRTTKDKKELLQLYANKMDNLEEMDKFLKTHNLSRLDQKEIESTDRLITSNEIKSV